MVRVTDLQHVGTELPDTEAIDRIQSSNRAREIDREIERKQNYIDTLNTRMNQEIEALRYQRQFASNNLAGANWEQSLATEMQALSDKYGIEINTLRDEINALRAERSDLLVR